MNYRLALKILIIACFFVLSVSAQITSESEWEMTRPVEPFRVIANVYYVGTNDVASYLITSDEGHILIDSGFEETVPLIEASVKKLGFDLKDVKILLNNHEHYDHCGGLKTLKEKTGAKLYSVREQAEVLARGGSNDFRFGGKQIFRPVTADKQIVHGEVITLGENKLITIRTPGHTKGATTWTMRVRDGDRDLEVVFLSSLSNLDYDLVSNDKYPEIGGDFESTFEILLELKPDVFLGSHASFFRMEKKFEMLKSSPKENPFIDPEGYTKFVERMREDFRQKLETQKKAAEEK
ncbi:MAG: subclass B3 metallo-beta-lactamase [Acidobacteriota bacterium]|nr:MAG: subclass B3 metallo-beta-lactamase [Acidobacteriota bacterium]